MGRFVRATWLSSASGLGIPRRDRESGVFTAYVPDGLAGRAILLDEATTASVALATEALERLQRASYRSAERSSGHLLRYLEAIGSCRIEDLEVSFRRLMRAEVLARAGMPLLDATARAVLGDVDAVVDVLEAPQTSISLDRLLDVHRLVLAGTNDARYGGVVRTEQNWIGGSSFTPLRAVFVPPPPEYVPALLEDLVSFCNDDGVPAVAQAAIAHAQFETIHPFIDGNGRAGRALIHMILRRRSLISSVVLPISLALASNISSYTNSLNATRHDGPETTPPALDSMNAWIRLFSIACVRAAAEAQSLLERVAELLERWRPMIGPTYSNPLVAELLALLPHMPVFIPRSAAQLLSCNVEELSAALDALAAVSVIRKVSIARGHTAFEAPQVIGVLSAAADGK
jgi:fido (protein-threonine AMPylation protein)